MSFVRSSPRRPSTARPGTVHAVGQRVYVTRSANGSARVDLTDDAGTKPVGHLLDGTEVMVIGWRPRGSTGTRYCVRCTDGGLEGWLAAANLQSSRMATPAPTHVMPPATPAAAPPARPSGDSKARFGGR